MQGFFGPGAFTGGFFRIGAVTPPLDVVGSATAAFSLRKLRAAYAGSAIRVRRSSDNTEADIGFDSSGNLDTAALLVHTGSNDGFVVTWYDQSGNGLDATQATTTVQPRIVNAGTVETMLGGKPALRFSGQNNNVRLANASFSLTNPFSVYVFGNCWNTRIVGSLGAAGVFVGSSANALTAMLVDPNPEPRLTTRHQADSNGQQISSMRDYAMVFIANPSGSTATSSNGANGTFTTVSTAAGTLTWSGLEIGCVGGGSLDHGGHINEIIVYPTNHGTNNRDVLNSNQMSYNAATILNYAATYVFDGDSLTTGSGASDYSYSYPGQIARSTTTQMMMWNDAVPGTTLNQFDSTAAAANGIDLITYDTQPVHLIVWGGTNDINGGDSGATAYTDLKTYVANRAATGKYSTITVLTCIQRGSGGLETAINDYNALIRTGIQPGGDLLAAGATRIVDVAALPQFDTAADTANATYYDADRIHLKDAGYALIAAQVKAALGI